MRQQNNNTGMIKTPDTNAFNAIQLKSQKITPTGPL